MAANNIDKKNKENILDNYLKHSPTPIVLHPEGTKLRKYIFSELKKDEELSEDEMQEIINLSRTRYKDYINRVKNLNSSFYSYNNISHEMSEKITKVLQKYISRDLACDNALKINVHATGYPEYLRESLLAYLDVKH